MKLRVPLQAEDIRLAVEANRLDQAVLRAAAKAAALAWSGGSLPLPKRLLVGMGIQPLSATAVFMAYELASLYPEVGRSALTLPLFAAAMMELAGPALCRLALRRSGECENEAGERGGIA